MSLTVDTPHISTKAFPATYKILDESIPSVLTSQCFNDQNLPFCVEVKATEMGHLLEHVLLEYLCIEKLNNGSEEADFSGETSWNWTREPHGTFTIAINCPMNDYIFFFPALEKSIQIIEKILLSKIDEQTKNYQSVFQPTQSYPTYSSAPTIVS